MRSQQSLQHEVQFLCPHTHLPVDTGIHTDAISLAKVWDRKMNLRCPHCGEEHDFRVREAYVEQVMRTVKLSA